MKKVRARPGYWCECTSRTPAGRVEPSLRATFEAESADQAVRWIRIALRTLASALDDEVFEQAWHWITTDHQAARQVLKRGRPYEVTLTYANTATTWTARPVLFLPLAHRQHSQLPSCAEEYSAAQLPGAH